MQVFKDVTTYKIPKKKKLMENKINKKNHTQTKYKTKNIAQNF